MACTFKLSLRKLNIIVWNFGKVYFSGGEFIGKVLFLLAYFIGIYHKSVMR